MSIVAGYRLLKGLLDFIILGGDVQLMVQMHRDPKYLELVHAMSIPRIAAQQSKGYSVIYLGNAST